MKIYDFNRLPLSYKDGLYGGAAGDKDGILSHGQMWLIKYPKSTKGMENVDISYTTSPVCEYLGSQIFRILGFDVHETQLGIRNGKLVVACRDFTDGKSVLAEIRTLKNAGNSELSERFGIDLGDTGDSHSVDLGALIVHLRENRILKSVPGLESRFFDQAVVDVFINNNDRNNGNWGILKYPDGRLPQIAPVFDNGGSFQSKLSDRKAETILNNRDAAARDACGTHTAYSDASGKRISSKRFLELQQNFPLLQAAILDVVPRIRNKMMTIKELIRDLPSRVSGPDGKIYEVCGDHVKDLYSLQLESRLDGLLIPAYERAKNMEQAPPRFTVNLLRDIGLLKKEGVSLDFSSANGPDPGKSIAGHTDGRP